MTLAVTLLTGLRPKLLDRTLRSVLEFQPTLFRYDWITLHNGEDPETAEVLRKWRAFIGPPICSAEFLDLGAATSKLFSYVAGFDAHTVLHLEDDWEAELAPERWLVRARTILDDVFQVRLRHSSEKVLTRHMVTEAPLRWSFGPNVERWPDHRISEDAHFTLNPSLLRAEDLPIGFPAGSEREAQKRFWDAERRKVAQLMPGVFRHIGGEDSLRKRHR